MLLLNGAEVIVPSSDSGSLAAFDARAMWMKQNGVLGSDDFQRQHPEAEFIQYKTCRCVMDARLRELLKGSEVPERISAFSLADFDSLPPHLKAGKENAIEIARYMCDSDHIVDEQGVMKFGAVLSGTAGLGKTVLAAQPVIARASRGELAIWTRWDDMITSIQSLYGKSQIEGYTGPTPDDVISKLQRVRLLVIDELFAVRNDQNPAEVPPPITPNQLKNTMSIIDYRYNYNLPILLTTNLNEDQVAKCSSTPLLQRLQEMLFWETMGGEPLRFWRRQ